LQNDEGDKSEGEASDGNFEIIVVIFVFVGAVVQSWRSNSVFGIKLK
jgi:hypothetical protein